MYPTNPTTIICDVRVSACHEWYWRRHSYRRSFDDSACLDDLLLVQLRARTVEVADDGGHAGLVAHGGSQVALLLGVVLREAVAQNHRQSMPSHSLPAPIRAVRFAGTAVDFTS
jgi:hypothetical protein